MATFTLFDSFVRDLMNGVIDLSADVFKLVLTNTAPVAATDEVFADLTEISAGNGYPAGGLTLTGFSVAETGTDSGIWQWTFDDITIAASGGSIGPFRYLVVCDTTPLTPLKPLVGFIDYGTATTLGNGAILTLDVGASGVIRAQAA
jgi:hypothetical protein